ncbi:MAG TPA: DUF420 domain-containing protein [Cytophagales bacterium]|nr:DUF420 domain-containing protein [Cytophagales bacterium]HAA17882.1 DUF420 domain-containing protein [Cytophagales bacterium]HAP58195.1 DUF420 domain-containing protein [Cytophagales bacterium]
MEGSVLTDKKTNVVINVISVVVPAVVAILLGIDNLKTGGAVWMKSLPGLNAILNSTTSVLLILSLIMIKRKNVAAHKYLMLTGLVLGASFLVSYIIYHLNVPSVMFGDANHDGNITAVEEEAVSGIRLFYFVLLISHIGLAVVALPFVLRAFAFALTQQWDRHRKVVKFAFPLWLYVSITGVVVYLMISPYYS